MQLLLNDPVPSQANIPVLTPSEYISTKSHSCPISRPSPCPPPHYKSSRGCLDNFYFFPPDWPPSCCSLQYLHALCPCRKGFSSVLRDSNGQLILLCGRCVGNLRGRGWDRIWGCFSMGSEKDPLLLKFILNVLKLIHILAANSFPIPYNPANPANSQTPHNSPNPNALQQDGQSYQIQFNLYFPSHNNNWPGIQHTGKMSQIQQLKEKLIEPHHQDHHQSQKNTERNRRLMEEEDDSEDEEELRRKMEIQSLEKEIKKKQATAKANNKVFVGSGFSFDITQFFKFKKQKELVSTGDDVKTVFEQLSGGHLSWIILIYSVCNAAMIPAWIMSIKATKLLRISWRFLLQAIMIIPFVLYERRKADPETIEKYKLSYIFNFDHLYIAYLSSFATSFWFTIILTTFEWSFISHTMFLGALANYFLSLGRTMRGNGHDLEPGGQVLITIGILMVIIDIYQFDPHHDAKPEDWHFINPWYLTRTRIQSVLADLIALGVSYCMSKFSVYTADLKNHYPPFLSMLLVNSMVCINMMFTTYFFNGATFDHDPFWGILSIISQKHFAAFMYMAIILCMGLVISFVMISNLFPDPIIPSLAMTFEPAISTLLLYLAGVQTMPTPLSFMGYILIIPGNFLILIGQWMFQLMNKKKKIQEQARITKLIEISEQKRRSLKRISERKSELSSDRSSKDEHQNHRNQKKRKNSMNEKLQQIKESNKQNEKQKQIEMIRITPPPKTS